MNSEFFRDNYNSLFNNETIKAKAFDKIAEQYYFGNFGSMSKSDFDVLMFSLFMDQLIEQHGNNMLKYSDYKISKTLGITQTKVSNLKIKKELKYPNNSFDWKESFLKIVNNATFDNDKIILNIPDPNLLIEIKNAIEEAGGYIEVELNSKLLKVSPRYFVDLMYIVSNQEDKKTIEKNVKSILDKNKYDIEYITDETYNLSIGQKIGVLGKDFVCDLIESIPNVGPAISHLIKNCSSMKKQNNKDKNYKEMNASQQ